MFPFDDVIMSSIGTAIENDLQIVTRQDIIPREPGPCLNINTVFPRYEDSHVKDKTVTRPFYL